MRVLIMLEAMTNIPIEYPVVVIGALIGSLKVQLSDRPASTVVMVLNVLVGIFAGVTLALNYLPKVSIWAAGLFALVASSLAVACIDNLFKLTPQVLNEMLKKWLDIDLKDLEDS